MQNYQPMYFPSCCSPRSLKKTEALWGFPPENWRGASVRLQQERKFAGILSKKHFRMFSKEIFGSNLKIIMYWIRLHKCVSLASFALVQRQRQGQGLQRGGGDWIKSHIYCKSILKQYLAKIWLLCCLQQMEGGATLPLWHYAFKARPCHNAPCPQCQGDLHNIVISRAKT